MLRDDYVSEITVRLNKMIGKEDCKLRYDAILAMANTLNLDIHLSEDGTTHEVLWCRRDNAVSNFESDLEKVLTLLIDLEKQ